MIRRGSGPVEGLGVGEHAAQPGLVAAQDADLEVRLPLRLGPCFGRIDGALIRFWAARWSIDPVSGMDGT
jgi:hypothetical protein